MQKNRVALITGGAKRVGRAIVERLIRSGFSVAFTYHSSRIEAESIAGATGAFAFEADLTQPENVGQICEAFGRRFEDLDVLVNNASLFSIGTLQDTDLASARRLMAVHYESPLLLCRHFETHLRRSRGHIVNMLDLMVERPAPQYIAYTASKAALWNLTQSLARSLAPEVTVNGIAPGVVEWPVDYPQTEREKYLKRVPLARAGTPEDIARTIEFLVTGGSYINGQIIRVDGGRSVT